MAAQYSCLAAALAYPASGADIETPIFPAQFADFPGGFFCCGTRFHHRGVNLTGRGCRFDLRRRIDWRCKRRGIGWRAGSSVGACRQGRDHRRSAGWRAVAGLDARHGQLGRRGLVSREGWWRLGCAGRGDDFGACGKRVGLRGRQIGRWRWRGQGARRRGGCRIVRCGRLGLSWQLRRHRPQPEGGRKRHRQGHRLHRHRRGPHVQLRGIRIEWPERRLWSRSEGLLGLDGCAKAAQCAKRDKDQASNR